MSQRTGPSVQIHTLPMWRIRFASDAPRYLLCTAAVAGALASLRFVVAPPEQRVVEARAVASVQMDLAAESYALLFAPGTSPGTRWNHSRVHEPLNCSRGRVRNTTLVARFRPRETAR